LTKEEITKLQKVHKDELKIIQEIRNMYKRKKNQYRNDEKVSFLFNNFEEFYYHISQYHSCCYCGISKYSLEEYFNENNQQYKKARQRGKKLELERIETEENKNVYSIDNTRLACYICNNAKSDFLSPCDFKPIAKGIYEFWKNSVGIKQIAFPEDSKIWEIGFSFAKNQAINKRQFA
jgi:hypothetical protein